jgi:DNA-binding NarL/FixJ family response regulator
VLRLVAAGRSNGEIAERLFITRKTAGVHVTHILNKLGVSNRVEAAMAAARLGLVDATDDPDDETHAGRTA